MTSLNQFVVSLIPFVVSLSNHASVRDVVGRPLILRLPQDERIVPPRCRRARDEMLNIFRLRTGRYT